MCLHFIATVDVFKNCLNLLLPCWSYIVSIYICYACYPSIYCKKLTLRAIILKNTSTKEIFKTARLKTGHTPCLKITKVKLILKPLLNAPIAKWKKPQFSFKLQRIRLTVFEWAKLEKDIKKIFHKNNCHKLNITIEGLLGECHLPSQDAVLVREKVATGKEI